MMVDNQCHLCLGRLLRHTRKITCKICSKSYHLKCLADLSAEGLRPYEGTEWYCTLCLEEIFPFNQISDDDIFMNTITEKSSYYHLQKKEFHIFDVDDDCDYLPLHEIDPDIQYFNNLPCFEIASKCDYFLEQSFLDKIEGSTFKEENFSLLNFNIRSMPKNLSKLDEYLFSLDFHFSLLGITETWLSETNASCYSVLGYNHEYLCRNGKRGGGVSIFVSQGFSYRRREEFCFIDDYCESLFIEIIGENPHITKNIIVGVIYRPPGTDTDLFINKISEILTFTKSESKDVYIMGDFNLDLLKIEHHAPTSDFVEIMYSHGLLPFINKPTRVSGSSTTIIDNIFSNTFTNTNVLNGIFYTEISDHFPIFTISSCQRKSASACHKRRDESASNIAKFSEALSSIDWSDVLESVGRMSFEMFLTKFNDLYNSSFPIKTIKSKYNNRKPWLTDGLKNSIQKKNKLYVQARKSNCSESILMYKRYKNKLNSLLKRAERDHFNNVLKACHGNMRKMWKTINEVINGGKKSNDVSAFKIGNETVSDKEAIVNHFNNYFSNIGKELDRKSIL